MAKRRKRREERPIKGWIYTASITLRNGRILYASQCGKRAFRIPVYD